jgi:hypothetical protein
MEGQLANLAAPGCTHSGADSRFIDQQIERLMLLPAPSDSWVTTVSQLRAPQLFDLLFVGEGPRDKEVTARGR